MASEKDVKNRAHDALFIFKGVLPGGQEMNKLGPLKLFALARNILFFISWHLLVRYE